MICYIVMTGFPGYWGRGDTITEACKKCMKAGAKKSELCKVVRVTGDPYPYVDGMGGINYAAEATTKKVYKKAISISFAMKVEEVLNDD